MKRKRFAPLFIDVYIMNEEWDYLYITPCIEYKHKCWYLWYIDLSFLKWTIRIELCRKDWNTYNEE